MKAKERNEIAEMVETAKELAEKDPQGFMLAKNSLDILKARAAMDKEVINDECQSKFCGQEG